MAVDSEPKRWSMLAFANGPVRSHVFNPETSGLVSIEKITVLQYYGGIAWSGAVAVTKKRIKDHTGLMRFITAGERGLDDMGEF